MSDARKFLRTSFGVKGVITSESKAYDFELINLSLKGALIHCPDSSELEMHRTMDMAIHLNNSEIEIRVECMIVHREMRENEEYQGCKFISIDPESMIHLRRLLELNTIPEGEIEKELTFLKD